MQKKHKLASLKIDQIRTNPSQGAERTSQTALVGISKNIENVSMLQPVLVGVLPDGQHVMLDGERRKNVRLAEGATYIEANVIPVQSLGEASEIWVALSAASREIRGRDYLVAWAQAPATAREQIIKRMPSSTASRIKELIEIFGTRRLAELALSGAIGPAVRECIKKVDRLIVRFNPPKEPTRKQIGEWIVNRKATALVGRIAAACNKSHVLKLVAAIAGNKELRFSGDKLIGA